MNELTDHLIRNEHVLAQLEEILNDRENNASARVSAARTLLSFPEPKNEDEIKREAEEREMSLAAARGLLADLAADKLACTCKSSRLDQDRAPEPADTTGQTA